MDDVSEIEITLLIGANEREALLEHPLLQGVLQFQNLNAVYYDTVDWCLHASGALLRTRTAGGDFEQTLKLAADTGSHPVERGEWNGHVHSNAPDPDALPAPAHNVLKQLLDGRALQPFARIETIRGTRTIDYQGSTIELAFDTAKIAAAGHNETIAELELELKQGRVRDLLRFALALPLGTVLQWSTLAKGERGFLLATGATIGAAKATPCALDSTMSGAAAFHKITWNCLDHLLRNYRQVIDDCDAEALHQSRVALRRLRAAFASFKDVITADESDILRAEIKAAASALAPARNLDVLIGTVKAHRAVAQSHPDIYDALLGQLEQQRASAYSEVRALLRGAPFQKLLFEVAILTEDGAWLTAPGENRAQARSMPVVELVARALSRRRRKLKKVQGLLAALDTAARHSLRIEVKKLRYTVDFAASLFASAKHASSHGDFSSALAKLQDHLGELNDIAASQNAELLDVSQLGEIEAARLSALLQTIFAAHGQSEKRLLRAAEKALDQTLLAKRFWKQACGEGQLVKAFGITP